MTVEQLSLFPELVHEPTVAERQGLTVVVMCSYCGLLAATAIKYKLGPCPACETAQWSSQPTEVGPFRKPKP